VRVYHPDSPASQALPSSVRHARFHAVTKAYDILRGRSNAHRGHSFAEDVFNAELARRRRQHARRQAYHQHPTSETAEAGGMSGADDAWKDQVIIFVGLAVRPIPSSSSRRHV
jgi:DnaJ-class molecular chaperone